MLKTVVVNLGVILNITGLYHASWERIRLEKTWMAVRPQVLGIPKKYTSLKLYIFVPRTDKSLNFISVVRQDLDQLKF